MVLNQAQGCAIISADNADLSAVILRLYGSAYERADPSANGTAPTQKAAAEITVIRAMVEMLDTTLQGIRDRAILLVGFAGAFRRSELAGLTLTDVQFTNDGLVITLRHSKTDQEGEGYIK